MLVYLREAHPCDGWAHPEWSGLEDAKDEKAREGNARACVKKLGFGFPVLLDGMEDRTAARWSAWPERLFVISRDGRIVYSGDQGPFGFNPGAGYAGYSEGPVGQEKGPSLEDFLETYLGKPAE